MDGEAGTVDSLSEVHAAVLRLHHDGLNDEAIAATLGLQVEAVPPLLRIAESKLLRLRREALDASPR